MKWLPDNTGRFVLRPHYEKSEIDSMCDDLILNFLVDRCGEAKFPISTDDLEVIIEKEASDLDAYANLPAGVEGMTEFIPDDKPRVSVSERLARHYYRNRRRSTLVHELGHVKLHASLWLSGELELVSRKATRLTIYCNRESILSGNKYDWMEWQAYYASGAYLMPITPLAELADRVFDWVIPLELTCLPLLGLD